MRFVGLTRFGRARRSPAPQRWQNRCRHCSPTDALIDINVRGHLGRFIPIWRNIDTCSMPTKSLIQPLSVQTALVLALVLMVYILILYID